PPQALTASMKMTRITNHLKRFMPFDTPYILDVRHTHDGFGLFRPPVSITSPRMAMRDCLLFHIVEHCSELVLKKKAGCCSWKAFANGILRPRFSFHNTEHNSIINAK